MALLILCDPRYRNNNWCETKLRGIYDEAARRRIPVKLFTDLDLFVTSASKLGGDSSVIILFNSFQYLQTVSSALSALEIHPILSVTESDISFSRAYSQVCGDVDSATKEVVDFLRSKGKRRIALLGSSENSAAGRNKEKTLLRHAGEDCVIFRNTSGLLQNFKDFLCVRDKFDTVICIDDYQAIAFVEFLQSVGAYAPSLYVISHGDTVLARMYGDGISTVSTSFYECGKTMVEAHVHRLKYNWSTVMVRVHCNFTLRGSTSGNASFPLPPTEIPENANQGAIGRLESLLCECDLVNLKLMYGLLSGYGNERMSELCFLSSGAVKYRLQRIREALRCKTREETAAAVGRYLTKEKLLEAIEKAEGTVGRVFM